MSELISDEERQKNFENWFKKSKVSTAGKPKKVYHGTLANFSKFDINKTNTEAFWGQGFYFSSSLKDVNSNYSTSLGADYQNKLEHTKEQLEREVQEKDWKTGSTPSEITDEYLTEIALQKLSTEHEGIIIPAYLSMQNPFNDATTKWAYSSMPEAKDTLKEAIDFLSSSKFKKMIENNQISLDKHEISSIPEYLKEFCCHEVQQDSTVDWEEFESYLTDNFCIEDDASKFIAEQLEKKFSDNVISEFEDPNNIINRLINHLENRITDIGFCSDAEKVRSAVMEILEDESMSYEEISLNAGEFIYKLKDKHTDFFDNTDETSFMDLIVEFLKSEGYDGIIMKADDKNFNMKMDKGTKHYICWEPTQIKSTIGNNGQYSPENEDILYRVAEKVDISHKIMPLQEVKETILEFSVKMDNFIKFRVFDNIEDAIGNKFLPEDADKNTKGFFYDPNKNGKGTIGIIRNNIEDKNDLLTTYVHEAVGHSSVKNMLGDKYKPTMIKLFDFYNRKHKSTFNPENDKFFTSEQKVKKAEEFLAVSIERKFNTGFSGMRLLVGAVLNKIRKIIPELPITSFDTDYIEKAAFNHYQKSELNDINVAKEVEQEIKGRNIVMNVPRKNKNNPTKAQPT